VFSNDRVQELAEKFVCVKIDPRESQEAAQFKATRYVPEVVFLTSDQRVITRLETKTVAATVDLMERILRKYGT
jgi:hypothetical protein